MFYDLKQAMEFAKKVNKPLFVDFTGHTCANCRKMEQQVWPDDQVRKLLLNEFVMVSLYADDETRRDSVITGFNGSKIRKVGDWVVDYQSHYFGTIAQPLYVLMDHDEKAMVAPKGFDLKVKNYIDFLNSGIAEFNKRHGIVADAPVAEAPAGH